MSSTPVTTTSTTASSQPLAATSPATSSAGEALSTSEGALAQIIRETEQQAAREQRVERTLPWVISLAAHAGMILLGILIPWTTTIILNQHNDTPPAVTADFNNLTFLDHSLDTSSPSTLDHSTDAATGFSTPALTGLKLDDHAGNSAADDLSGLSQLLRIPPAGAAGDTQGQFFGPIRTDDVLKGFRPQGSGQDVSFSGLHGSHARNIVYVVDASGSMVAYLPIVIHELVRSIDKLAATQNFRVIFFQKEDAVLVPGPGEDQAQVEHRKTISLLPASETNKRFVFNWMNLDHRNIRAEWQSNPIAAIDMALNRMEPAPDVVFILSTDITGLGDYEIRQDDLLKMIAQENTGPGGRPKALIKTIQFVYQDPLGTLRKIAEQNGGLDGYRFMSRKELGLDH